MSTALNMSTVTHSHSHSHSYCCVLCNKTVFFNIYHEHKKCINYCRNCWITFIRPKRRSRCDLEMYIKREKRVRCDSDVPEDILSS